MIWRVVKDTFRFLDEEAREITQNYEKVHSGTKTAPPRWETCAKLTAGRLYLQRVIKLN